MLVFEIAIIVALTLLNGVFAMSELAVVSSRKSRLQHMAEEGVHGARTALRLIDDPSRFLSTVQIGITMVGVVAGAYGGATLGDRLGSWLITIPGLEAYGRIVGVGAGGASCADPRATEGSHAAVGDRHGVEQR